MIRSIVMMGTDPSGRGGIAAVADQYLAQKSRFEVPLVYLTTHKTSSALRIFSLYAWSLVRLLGLLMARKVCLVHVHCASRGSFFRKSFLLALARSFGIPTVLHLHGGGFSEFYQSIRFKWLQSWISYSLEHSSRVLVLSESWLAKVKTIAPTAKVDVLPNTVAQLNKPNVMHLDTPSGDDPRPYPLILFAGRIDQLKGVEDLVRALPRILKDFPNTKLVFAGDGDMQKLRRRIAELKVQDHVSFLGWVSPSALEFQYQLCTVFALPSYAEGLPMAVLEAMAHGKPIVVSPVGGIPEALMHLESALFVKPGSVSEIANAILKLSFDPNLALRLGEQAQRNLRQRYGVVEHFESLNQLYRELIAIKP